MKFVLRHRALSIALLVFTLLASGAAFEVLPWTYQAESDVVLIPSQNAGVKIGQGNPYLAFTGSVNELGDVIGYEMNDKREQQDLASQGFTSSYTLAAAVNTSAPILVVTVTGSSSANVESTLSAVTHEITKKLSTTQSELRSDFQIQAQVISYTTNPTKVTSKKTRPLLGVFAVLLILSAAVVFAVDTVQARRRNGGRTEPRGSAPQEPMVTESSRVQESPRVQEPARKQEPSVPAGGGRSAWTDAEFKRSSTDISASLPDDRAARSDADSGSYFRSRREY